MHYRRLPLIFRRVKQHFGAILRFHPSTFRGQTTSSAITFDGYPAKWAWRYVFMDIRQRKWQNRQKTLTDIHLEGIRMAISWISGRHGRHGKRGNQSRVVDIGHNSYLCNNNGSLCAQ